MRLLVLLLVLLAGCGPAHVPLADPGADATAKRVGVPPDVTHLYVVRPDQREGRAALFTVRLGSQPVRLAPATYTLLVLPPGLHTLTVSSAENVEQAAITAVPGQALFYQVRALWGVGVPRVALTPLGEPEGRQAIQESALVR